MKNIEMRINFIGLMEQWAEKETSLRIRDFCAENGLYYDTSIRQWAKEYPDFYDAYYKVMKIIEERKRNRKKAIKELTQTEIDELISRRNTL